MSQAASLKVTTPHSDIAVLTFDMPGKGANVLSRGVLDELSEHLDYLEKQKDLAGLVITSGKPGTFIAGADLREFATSLDISQQQIIDLCRRGQKLFGRLSQCPFVTVAAIEGVCLGGGAELAIWCDRRILSRHAKTEFGFPEVKLGLFPGWGGTARASRIVGLGNAVEMITSGDSISPETAYAMGLASQVTAPESSLDAAIQMIRIEQQRGDYLRDRQKWSGPVDISPVELGFLGATASGYIQSQTKGHYPAPLAALEVMVESTGDDIDTACKREAEGMAALFGSPVNAALLNVFFLTDRNKKDRGVSDEKIKSDEIGSVSVIGAGIMGAGITAANVKRDILATISDVTTEALASGVRNVLEEVSYNKQTRGADPERIVQYAPLVNGTTSEDEVVKSDLIIEAIVENADIKKNLFARLEPKLREDTILASNTSTIPITQLAADLAHPERFCGIHFFNPVRRMKLVEVIRGEQTSDQTVASAVAYVKRIGKAPIVVNDGPGFLVNRLLLPYMHESLELLSEGVPIAQIERTAKRFGMPMGPIELYDMVGIDTATFAGRTMWEAFPDRIKSSPILPALVKLGRLGRKSGAGFFNYQNRKKRAQPDPQLGSLLKEYIGSSIDIDHEQLTARLFLPMFLEATRVLEEGIVRDPRDIDLGLIFGLGFPPFKGGLMFWADQIGVNKIQKMLAPLEDLGGRFQTTELLNRIIVEKKTFYGISG